MKKILHLLTAAILTVLLICSLVFSASSISSSPKDNMTGFDIVEDMKIGWNLGNTLDCYNVGEDIKDFETAWGNPKTTKEIIDAVKKAGFNAVRIPISWNEHTKGNTVDENWLLRVKEVVDYVIDNDMYAIINMHHDDYTWLRMTYADEETVTERFKAIWQQISVFFKDYDYRLLFEAMNEPRTVGEEGEWTGGTDETHTVVNRLLEVFVETVRSSHENNKNRFLIITTHGASIEKKAVEALKIPEDKRLIVSVHSYIPYDFALNEDGTASWGSFDDKFQIEKTFDRLKRLFINKGIPVIIGEFNATNKDNDSTRAEYTYYYIKAAKKRGITCFIWDNGEKRTFGLLDRQSCNWWYEDIVNEAVRAAEANYSYIGRFPYILLEWIRMIFTFDWI